MPLLKVQEEKGHEKILEEITAENFPKMGKEIVTQVHETQRVSVTRGQKSKIL